MKYVEAVREARCGARRRSEPAVRRSKRSVAVAKRASASSVWWCWWTAKRAGWTRARRGGYRRARVRRLQEIRARGLLAVLQAKACWPRRGLTGSALIGPNRIAAAARRMCARIHAAVAAARRAPLGVRCLAAQLHRAFGVDEDAARRPGARGGLAEDSEAGMMTRSPFLALCAAAR